MTLPAGSRLGPYEILASRRGRDGRGLQGERHAARAHGRGQGAPVTPLAERGGSAALRAGGEDDLAALAPHICALYDVGNQDGVEYLVMEYLEGEPHPLPNFFDAAADGERFLMISSGVEQSPPITLLQNWTAGIKK